LRLDELDTPFAAVDLDVFEANVRLAFERLRDVDVRPHLKTAKSVPVARRLIDAGAVGVCVATLGELEAMLPSVVDDVLVTTEVAGEVKAARLAQLVRAFPGARLRVVVDSVEGARHLHEALDRPVEALIDVNVAQNRTGVPPSEVAALADAVAPFHRLRVVGLQGYEGNLQHVTDAAERRAACHAAMDRLASAGSYAVVTTGGTGTAEFCAEHEIVTEVQPGSFIFMDSSYGAVEGVPYASSLKVVATVISHPAADRVVVDAGLKALSQDMGDAVVARDGWSYSHAGDEHGILTPAGGAALTVGDRVALIPSHCDTTVNLHDRLYAHRGETVEEVWPVARR
jgi:D-serine deaminase-like pyridoxal phosphate-dependent protein